MVQQSKTTIPRNKTPVATDSKRAPNMSSQKKEGADMHKVGSAGSKKVQNGFRTDTAISGNRTQGHRELQPWKPDADMDSKTFAGSSLESSSTGAGWDQFAVNEKLFGVKSDYDETFYTTRLNRDAPDFASRMAAADRKAKEIERSTATNSHVREERMMNNTQVDESGQDEEDKYSGVLNNDAYPSGDKSTRYVAPARRPPSGQPTVKGAPVDPAIISSQLAKPRPAAEVPKPVASPAVTAPAAHATPPPKTSTPPAVADVKAVSTPEVKATPANTSATSATSSPQGTTPNATATVERDVATAFKSFASQQRNNVNNMRTNKARADKESKLSDLKRFSENFKLNTPVPTDLVPIIAKDPAKQQEIQEKSKRNAEQQERDKLAKLNSAEASAAASPAPDAKAAIRPTVSPQNSAPATGASQSRQNAGRAPGPQLQGPYASQSYRGSGPAQGQPITPQQARGVPQNLGARLRGTEKNSGGSHNPPPAAYENRPPPTGPSNGAEASFSRRSSGANSVAKLNPSTQEFRPSAFAPAFNPTSNPTTTASTRAGSVSGPVPKVPSPATNLMRQFKLKGSAKPFVKDDLNILKKLSEEKPEEERKARVWAANGGLQPAYDTPPTWKSAPQNVEAGELDNSPINMRYDVWLQRSSMPAMSPSQPHTVPQQVPHQHQLPFHLQQGAPNAGPRNSPRQPSNHMQGQMHSGPNGHYNGAEDHRMIPSHSAQSFASPRLNQANMAYQSQMTPQHQQMMFQNSMQYPMNGPQTPQMQYRSYSGGGPQYMNGQPGQVGAPVMIQGPGPNGFMGPSMAQLPAGMMYPSGQFIQGPPPMMPGANGYPSPGRPGAPMMMQQGSQQGHQPGYGVSPGMQYGQPMYAQPQQGQMPMRGYSQGQQQFNTSPQMNHQFSSGGYNKNNNYQQQRAHPPAQQTQLPTGPQARPDVAEEAK